MINATPLGITSAALFLLGAGLSGKALYHGVKGAKMDAAKLHEMPHLITKDKVDPEKAVAKIPLSELQRPIKVINTLEKAKATKDKGLIKAFQTAEFGGNAFAHAPKRGKYNLIIVPKEVNVSAVHHEIGHLRKDNAVTKLDSKRTLFVTKELVDEEAAAWEFANRYVPKSQEQDKLLNTYKKGYQGGKALKAMTGALAATGAATVLQLADMTNQ